MNFELRYGRKPKVVDLDSWHTNQVDKLYQSSIMMAFYFGLELHRIRTGKPRSIGKVGAGKYRGQPLCNVPEDYLRVFYCMAMEDSQKLYYYLCDRLGIPYDGFDSAGGGEWGGSENWN